MTVEERVRRFVKPLGTVMTARAEVVARVYASAIASSNGSRIDYARNAVDDFLKLLDDV